MSNLKLELDKSFKSIGFENFDEFIILVSNKGLLKGTSGDHMQISDFTISSKSGT